MTVVDVSTLQLGDQIGDPGGQGTVFTVASETNTVFKRYHNSADRSFNPGTLRQLIAERGQVGYVGTPVDEWAAWPKAIVVDGPTTIGFLMRRVPEEFFITIRGRDKLADLSFLAAEPSPLWGGVPLPSPAVRVEILRHFAGAMQALHQRQIVLGDVSFANVLWAVRPRPRVMLIDCDGMRREGRLPVLPQAETLDWNDPLAAAGSAPDMDRDRYKLALAVLRVLAGRLDARPGADNVVNRHALSEHARVSVGELLQLAAGPVGTRPTAVAWAAALAGRQSITVGHLEGRIGRVEMPAAKPDLVHAPKAREYRPVKPLQP
jgi:hypothetical protein